MPRVLVACVPRRRAASSATTTSCTSGPLNGCSKTSPSSATVPSPPRENALGIGAHLHGPALGPRHRAADQHQVAVRHQLDDGQPALGDALGPHVAPPADAREHARRRRRRADRAGGAHVVGAVRLGAGVELVPLDGALEALALGHAGHLHDLADLEGLHRHAVADHELPRLVAELAQRAHRRGVDLPEMAQQRLVERLLARGAEPELHGLVAVRVGAAVRRHGARAGLQDGHALDAPVFEEALRHAELLGEDGGHQLKASRISMSTPAGRGSSRCSESTVLGVGWWMSIRRLCVRISKCSWESLSLKGDLTTAYTFFSVGRGTGPETVAPVRVAVSTISLAAVSMADESYALRRMRILFWAMATFCPVLGVRFEAGFLRAMRAAPGLRGPPSKGRICRLPAPRRGRGRRRRWGVDIAVAPAPRP